MTKARVTLRSADAADAKKLHAIITETEIDEALGRLDAALGAVGAAE